MKKPLALKRMTDQRAPCSVRGQSAFRRGRFRRSIRGFQNGGFPCHQTMLVPEFPPTAGVRITPNMVRRPRRADLHIGPTRRSGLFPGGRCPNHPEHGPSATRLTAFRRRLGPTYLFHVGALKGRSGLRARRTMFDIPITPAALKGLLGCSLVVLTGGRSRSIKGGFESVRLVEAP
jgi:hypothetical protein